MINKDDAEILMAVWLATRNYSVEIVQDILADGTLVYMAYNRELKGCTSHGATQSEALRNLRDARIVYILSLIQDGLEVPPPNPHTPYKTVFRLTQAGRE